MKKLIFSFAIGLILFVSAFAATSVTKKFLAVDDCPNCEASIFDENGKRCILNGCSEPGNPVTICSYNCGSVAVPGTPPKPIQP